MKKNFTKVAQAFPDGNCKIKFIGKNNWYFVENTKQETYYIPYSLFEKRKQKVKNSFQAAYLFMVGINRVVNKVNPNLCIVSFRQFIPYIKNIKAENGCIPVIN